MKKDHKKDHSQNPEQGNVLFLILIAVALFAALSFAATQTLRNTPADGAKDSEKIRAAELTQYPTFIGEALMRMRVGGISEEILCFDSDNWDDDDYNHAGCNDPKNNVFMRAGGGASWMEPADGANQGEDWYITGQTCIVGVGTYQGDDCNSDGDSSSEEIVMFLPNINRSLCLELNEKLGIINPGGNPPRAAGDLWPAGMPVYAGTFADGGRIDSIGSGDVAVLAGASFGCVEGAGNPPAGTYTYFHVLLRR